MRLRYAWKLRLQINPKLHDRMGDEAWNNMWGQVNRRLTNLYTYLDSVTVAYLDHPSKRNLEIGQGKTAENREEILIKSGEAAEGATQ